MLELVVIKRRRNWDWRLHDPTGLVVAGGREKTRPAARYCAYRALFLAIASGWKATRQKPSRTTPAAGPQPKAWTTWLPGHDR
jgi:hypothetical protein